MLTGGQVAARSCWPVGRSPHGHAARRPWSRSGCRRRAGRGPAEPMVRRERCRRGRRVRRVRVAWPPCAGRTTGVAVRTVCVPVPCTRRAAREIISLPRRRNWPGFIACAAHPRPGPGPGGADRPSPPDRGRCLPVRAGRCPVRAGRLVWPRGRLVPGRGPGPASALSHAGQARSASAVRQMTCAESKEMSPALVLSRLPPGRAGPGRWRPVPPPAPAAGCTHGARTPPWRNTRPPRRHRRRPACRSAGPFPLDLFGELGQVGPGQQPTASVTPGPRAPGRPDRVSRGQLGNT